VCVCVCVRVCVCGVVWLAFSELSVFPIYANEWVKKDPPHVTVILHTVQWFDV
jgi:hypothetical protein